LPNLYNRDGDNSSQLYVYLQGLSLTIVPFLAIHLHLQIKNIQNAYFK